MEEGSELIKNSFLNLAKKYSVADEKVEKDMSEIDDKD